MSHLSHRARTEGSCLCGAVRYEVAGPFSMMVHCHCSMCRKHHGAAFATFVGAPLMSFKWLSGEDHVVTFQSSEKGHRFFCRTCGSVTPTLAPEMDLALLPAGNLRGDLDMRAQSHVFVGSKAPWYTITDSVQQHEEYPPEFGLGGVERPIVDAPPDVVVGSCLCGSIAYAITAPPLLMVNCHCSRCRRGRSAAHATNLACKIGDVRLTRESSAITDYRVPEAKYFGVTFCRRCGGAVPRKSVERGIWIVPAGTLDTDPGVRPQMHIHVASKANWFDITDSLPQYAAGPPA